MSDLSQEVPQDLQHLGAMQVQNKQLEYVQGAHSEEREDLRRTDRLVSMSNRDFD